MSASKGCASPLRLLTTASRTILDTLSFFVEPVDPVESKDRIERRSARPYGQGLPAARCSQPPVRWLAPPGRLRVGGQVAGSA